MAEKLIKILALLFFNIFKIKQKKGFSPKFDICLLKLFKSDDIYI